MTSAGPGVPDGPHGPKRPGGPGSQDAPAGAPDGEAGTQLRVTTIELFFDLVFAFTLTQLTTLLADGASPAALAQVLLIFTLIWTAILASVIIAEQRLEPPGDADRHARPGPGSTTAGWTA